MKRGGRVIGKVAGAEPHKLSDKAARYWEKYYGPMQAAAASLNAAIANTHNIIGAVVLEIEGFDPATHIFDADNMQIVQRPKGDGSVA